MYGNESNGGHSIGQKGNPLNRKGTIIKDRAFLLRRKRIFMASSPFFPFLQVITKLVFCLLCDSDSNRIIISFLFPNLPFGETRWVFEVWSIMMWCYRNLLNQGIGDRYSSLFEQFRLYHTDRNIPSDRPFKPFLCSRSFLVSIFIHDWSTTNIKGHT